MDYNYKISRSDKFVEAMNMELMEASVSIRVHVSGDFYSQEYLDKWFMIARNNPRQIFYGYTKSLSLDYRKRPRNFIIYLSDDQRVLQKEYKRFDGVATISFDKKPIPGFSKCRHQSDGIHCAHCGLCMKKKGKVYFDLH
jgi:lipocalin